MTISTLRFLVGAFGVAAMLATSYPAAADPINVTGKAEDVKAFNDMIAACRKKSKTFDKLISDIEKDKTRGGKVNISVGRTGGYVDNATGGMGHTDVNVSNVEKFPDPDVDAKGKLKDMPMGVPPWATTRCEIMAHFIMEAHVTASTASKDIDTGHQAGIDCQRDVRKGFGQETPSSCFSQINHYKDEKKKTGFLYTQISYGQNWNIKLYFDKNDMLDLNYYRDGDKEYVPPKPKVTPKKGPAKAATKGDVSFQPEGNTCSTARSQAQLLALGCVNDPNNPRVAQPVTQTAPAVRNTKGRDDGFPPIYQDRPPNDVPGGNYQGAPGGYVPGGVP